VPTESTGKVQRRTRRSDGKVTLTWSLKTSEKGRELFHEEHARF
jgi:hypothetical protein